MAEPGADTESPTGDGVQGGDVETAKQAEEASSGGGFLFLVIGVVVVLLGGGVATAVTQYSTLSTQASAWGIGPLAEPDSTIQYGVFLEMENMVVNPAGTEGRRYLMVSLGLEAERSATLQEIDEHEIVIRDMVIDVLSRRSVRTLSDIAYREEIKEELRMRINNALRSGEVKRLYFTQYVLQ